jgi:hypothetical protein
MPAPVGSINPRAAFAAIAASTALPPLHDVERDLGGQWLAGTIACGAITSERVMTASVIRSAARAAA